MEAKEQQFRKLIKEHKDRIYTVCYMFSDDNDEVADLFQEVLINIWQGIDSFKGEAQLSTWIWRVATNTCITYDRKRNRRVPTIPLTMDINLFADQDEDSRQIRQLYERINRLGYLDRALVLLWLENLTYEEIGQITGLTAKNVSVKLVRIRQQLKNMK